MLPRANNPANYSTPQPGRHSSDRDLWGGTSSSRPSSSSSNTRPSGGNGNSKGANTGNGGGSLNGFSGTPKGTHGTPATGTPPPGQWRHPRMDEITRRANNARFGEKNARVLLWNIPLLVFSFYLPGILTSLGIDITAYIPYFSKLSTSWIHPFTFSLTLLRLIFIFNIYTAMRPLYAITDELADISLTPSQRALLNLPPLTPQSAKVQRQLLKDRRIEGYITPPRYTASPVAHSSVPSVSSASRSGAVVPGAGLDTSSPTPGTLFRNSLSQHKGSASGGGSGSGGGPSTALPRRDSFSNTFGAGSDPLRRSLFSQSGFGNSTGPAGAFGTSTSIGMAGLGGSSSSPQSSPVRRAGGGGVGIHNISGIGMSGGHLPHHRLPHHRNRNSINGLPPISSSFDFAFSTNSTGAGGAGGGGGRSAGGAGMSSQPGTPSSGSVNGIGGGGGGASGGGVDDKGTTHGKFMYERLRQSQNGSGNSLFTSA